ncbi:hypothetical protein ACWDUK_24855 [Streptomyces cellulosae]
MDVEVGELAYGAAGGGERGGADPGGSVRGCGAAYGEGVDDLGGFLGVEVLAGFVRGDIEPLGDV